MHGQTFTTWAPMPGPAALKPLATVLAALDLVVAWLLCVAMTAMVVVVGSQVALRYGFNSSLDWADEIARMSFVWSIFLAIALGVKTGSHIGIEVVVARFPPRVRDALGRLVALVCASALLLVAGETLSVARDQWDELMGAVNASTGWFLVPLVIGGVHGALHLLWIALTGSARGTANAVATE
jgi:TRAP-type transport system small permease protein